MQDIVDDRSVIACRYAKGWFLIDIVAIIPFDVLIKLFATASGNYNEMIRIARLGRLYKLVKITRLIRLVKLMK